VDLARAPTGANRIAPGQIRLRPAETGSSWLLRHPGRRVDFPILLSGNHGFPGPFARLQATTRPAPGGHGFPGQDLLPASKRQRGQCRTAMQQSEDDEFAAAAGNRTPLRLDLAPVPTRSGHSPRTDRRAQVPQPRRRWPRIEVGLRRAAVGNELRQGPPIEVWQVRSRLDAARYRESDPPAGPETAGEGR
jgi:hypothetical protein